MLNTQSQYASHHATTVLPIPKMLNRFKQHMLYAIQLALPTAPDRPLFGPIYKFLPGSRHIFHAAHAIYFHPSSPSNAFCFNVAIAEEFMKVNYKYQVHNTAFNATSANITGVLDNSANVCVIRNKSLFISVIEACPLGVNVGAVVGSTPPQGVGTARIAWTDDSNVRHSLTLHDALHYPDSPANAISIAKLGSDNNDMLLNTQTFPTQSIFTWGNDSHSMLIQHSPVNLPELSLHPTHDPIALLARKESPEHLSLSKDDLTSLFENISKSELTSLLHPKPLSPLERGNQFYHHKLKYLPHKHMNHLINMHATPKRLSSVTPPPCLACLLGKSKKRP